MSNLVTLTNQFTDLKVHYFSEFYETNEHLPVSAMNSARKLPRLNSDPNGYDKEAQYDNFNKVGHTKFRSFRRSSSPDREGGDRGRGDRGDNSMYSKYNNHRQEREYNKYGNSRKDIRDTDRDRWVLIIKSKRFIYKNILEILFPIYS
jgi:hypothetical protein